MQIPIILGSLIETRGNGHSMSTREKFGLSAEGGQDRDLSRLIDRWDDLSSEAKQRILAIANLNDHC